MQKTVIARTSRAQLDKSATIIQNKLFRQRIGLRKEMRELRRKIAELPMICRSSYAKVYFLKRSTGRLMNEVISFK